jgi:hypothetical protein
VLIPTNWSSTIFGYGTTLHTIAVNAEDAILSFLWLFNTGVVVASVSFSYCIRALQAGRRWKVLLSGSYLKINY